MSLPSSNQIELPILQELSVVGGTDNIKFLYQRLISYFPSLSDAEIFQIQHDSNYSWRKRVQKSGKILSDQGFIKRYRGIWELTPKGSEFVIEKRADFLFSATEEKKLSHLEVQKMTAKIGRMLGFYAELEFEFYDVIWRENENNTRISHVFEVQSKGNIDSAFAKLKRAFDAQRSKPFLIIASDSDVRRAVKSTEREFQALEKHITILSFSQIKKIYDNIFEISDVLDKFLDK